MFMAIPQVFPPRKRRPSPEAFIFPNVSNLNLVQSLLLLSQEISSLKPLDSILKRCSASMISKSKVLSILFEEILCKQRVVLLPLPPSATLCFEEIYVILQRIKTLLEDCANGSKMWLLMQNKSVSNNFYEIMAELSTLLDIFPLKEFNLNEDVTEMVVLVRKQCWEKKAFIDPTDNNLRLQVSKLLDQIKKEIIPDHSKLQVIFQKLGFKDSKSCQEEIESLEEEVQNSDKPTAEILELIGLVRYAKCVLFGASTPRSNCDTSTIEFETSFPVDFRCPISLDIMRDPVVVSTGQTYDRSSINHWIDSGHNTCPKTGQLLSHTNLISNRALKNLIALWCREQKIPFEVMESSTSTSSGLNGVTANKAALEATKMTALFLVNKLSGSVTPSSANRLVYELRQLAKMDSDNRACIAEAGAISALVKYIISSDSNLQINAVTTILNLSILDANKKRIMESNGVVDGIVEMLRSGLTWEAKQNAAATIFSLSATAEYRKKLGKKTRVVKGLIEVAKDGPVSAKRDALVALLNLAGEREVVGRLIDGGIVDMAVGVAEAFPEEAMAIIASVAKRGGVAAVVAAFEAVRIMGGVLRDGPPRARESAVAGLVSVCRRGGAEVVAQLASMTGIERAIWELMATGTARAKRKAASLLRIIRRWAAGVVDDHRVVLLAHVSRTVTNS